MPRVVDHDERRRDIANISSSLLARGWADGLSLRRVTAGSGGPLTSVTHY